MKAVHFGAGKIGRGFIADLIHETGYEITFVDVNEKLNDELNKYHNYYLYLIEDNYQRKEIDHVSALSPNHTTRRSNRCNRRSRSCNNSSLADNFPKIARSLAQGLKARLEAGKTKVNVIPCENALFCGDMLKEEIIKTGIITKEELDQIAAVPNTAVDRMVFGTDRDGRDGIEIGKDYELVIEVDKLADPQNLPIKGPEYTDNFKKISREENYIRSMGDMPGQDILHI